MVLNGSARSNFPSRSGSSGIVLFGSRPGTVEMKFACGLHRPQYTHCPQRTFPASGISPNGLPLFRNAGIFISSVAMHSIGGKDGKALLLTFSLPARRRDRK